MEIEKRVAELRERLAYTKDIFGGRENANIALMESRLAEFAARERDVAPGEKAQMVRQIEDLFGFLEKKLDAELSPMDMVRVVRHSARVSLKDILENVYDNYAEIGGQDEYSIDPSMLIARATIARRQGDKVVNQPVMVIGQEKGHGQEFRNGGSVKPWGNAKALQYMKVAETERIPIHTYVFTPGAYPVEEYPGAAQQIARNLYEMAGLRVPVVSVISEGGSGGAEAIGLSDVRLMLSRGYYSVISPEGAAAIEAGIRQDQRVAPELIEACANRLKITAADNLAMGYIDKVVDEPPLGARPHHYDFFKELRQEVIQATDQDISSASPASSSSGPWPHPGARRDAPAIPTACSCGGPWTRPPPTGWSGGATANTGICPKRPSRTAARRTPASPQAPKACAGPAIPWSATIFWANMSGIFPRPFPTWKPNCAWWPTGSRRRSGAAAVMVR